MPSAYTRRTLLSLCATGFGLGTAGCLGGSSDDSAPAETTTGTVETASANGTATSTHPTPDETTIPASVVPDAGAKERALAAEKEYLVGQFEDAPCLDDWGTYPTTASKRATVTGRTPEDVRVEVVHPYSYSTDRSDVDGASRADYLVTADEARRTDGDTVSPC
jgi:hypothetical protein